MIRRPRHVAEIDRALAHNPACALLGPRQCGKTTLAYVLQAWQLSRFLHGEQGALICTKR